MNQSQLYVWGLLIAITFLFIEALMVLARKRHGTRQAGVTKFSGLPTSVPVTPEPNYICANCGMLIKSMHAHTREECELYQNDPTKPDGRAHKTILPGKNDPKIRLPNYYTFGIDYARP